MTVELGNFVPELRTDFERRDLDGECVVWSPIAAEPVVFDPVAMLMLDVIDGEATMQQLVTDVHEVVEIPLETAQQQVARIVELYSRAGLLTTSPAGTTPEAAIARRELFVLASTPCSENASRLGTVTLCLQFADRTVRVTCDSRRGARVLREALVDHIVDGDDDVPLAFVLTAPQGLRRSHHLSDRAGFVLSEARGLDAGLRALACHLTAFLPPAPGTVRIGARGIVTARGAVVCLSPLLYFPVIGERALAQRSLGLIDRLALDFDVETGHVTNPEVPWPALGQLRGAPAHAGTGGTQRVTAVVSAAAGGTPPPSRAAVVTALARQGLHGSVGQLLDAAVRATAEAQLLTAPPDADHLVPLLVELGKGASSRTDA
jgi:hypothetical protein